MNKLAENAISYASLGWKVFPLHSVYHQGVCTCPKGKDCKNAGKHPKWHKKYLPNGLKNATNDPEVIKGWGRLWENANIGIKTGAESGFIVLDIDTKNDGYESLKELITKYGELPKTPQVFTGSGGLHILFKHPGWFVRNSAGEIAEGIDVRADGGYIVAAPSLHKSGKRYEWAEGYSPFDIELAEVPGWLADLLQKKVDHVTNEARQNYHGRVWKKLTVGEPIGEGTRDNTLFKMACWMRAKGAGYEDILATLIEVNKNRCVPPMEEEEVRKKAEQAVKYEKGIPDRSLLDFADTDYGNAERLVYRHGVDLKYCTQMETWLVWDGTRWAKDEHFEVYRRAMETIRAFHKEALWALEELKAEVSQKNSDELSKKEKGELKDQISKAEKRVNFARNSEFKARIEAMVTLAKTLPGVPVSVNELDADKYLINLKNGTYDLANDTFREHRREDLITKVTNVEYTPAANAPRWEQFVSEIMNNDPEMVGYLQRLSGLCLSGDTTEEYLFMPYGSGGNGKSKFIAALLHVLGDYGQQAPSSLLMARKNDQGAANPDLVRIRGTRFVATTETGDGKKLDEELVKLLTGNDTITTRDLYQKPFSFKPEAKFFIATNHKPLIGGTDNGIWRRVLLIPFEVSFTGKKKDPRLEEKLIAEANGILNWMIEGFRQWKEKGVNPPAKVVAATDEYRAEMDSLGAFFEECCVIHPEARATKKELYQAYKEWAMENGERLMKNRMFSKRITERGFQELKSGSTRFWEGIGLLENYGHLVWDKRDERDIKTEQNLKMKTKNVIHLEKLPQKSVPSVPNVPSENEVAATIGYDWEEGEL